MSRAGAPESRRGLSAGDRENIAQGTHHHSLLMLPVVNQQAISKLAWMEYLSVTPSSVVSSIGRQHQTDRHGMSLYYAGYSHRLGRPSRRENS